MRCRVVNDIELTCHAAGDAYVVYAGTGSIAAFLDATGTLQRAGGRGGIIDDAGSGHWLARQALCQVWRAEDDEPGAWQRSPLAQRLFARIGGSEWAQTRAWVYGASRGELGTLALAVAEAAQAPEPDPVALALLHQAGAEIARLGMALMHRHGPRTAGDGRARVQRCTRRWKPALRAGTATGRHDLHRLAAARTPHGGADGRTCHDAAPALISRMRCHAWRLVLLAAALALAGCASTTTEGGVPIDTSRHGQGAGQPRAVPDHALHGGRPALVAEDADRAARSRRTTC
jgi:hypothetical protein